jgi:hypothetical protein
MVEEHTPVPDPPVPKKHDKRSLKTSLLILFLVALLLRLGAWSLFSAHAPELRGDERYYVRAARSIAAGTGYPEAFRPPLHSALMAVVLRLGGDLNHIRGFQVVVSLLGIWLIFDLTRRHFGPRAGLCAGWMAAVAPQLVHYCHFLWSENLAAFLFTLFLWLMDRTRHNIWCFAAGGVALGLLALTREEWLFLAPIAAGWIIFQREKQDRWHRWWAAGLFVLAVVLTIAPWSWRNYRYFDRWVTISTNHWMPMAIGNRARGQYGPYPGISNRELRKMSAGLDTFEYERFYRQIALESIVEQQPWWLGRKLVTHTPKLFSLKIQSIRFFEMKWITLSRCSALVLVTYGLLGTLIVVGAGLSGLAVLTGSRLWQLAVAALSLKYAIHIASLAHARMLVPLIPIFAIFAGALVASRCSGYLGRKERNRILLLMIVYLIVVLGPIVQRFSGGSQPLPPKTDIPASATMAP